MTSAEVARIMGRVARGLAAARAVKVGLLTAGLLAVAGLWQRLLPTGSDQTDLMVLLVSAGTWMALAIRGTTSLRLVNAAAGYAATRRVDLAEQALTSAATTFGLFRGPRLLAMQNLAALCHSDRRFDQAAQICRFLLQRSGRALKGFDLRNRLLLADSEVMLGNLTQAHAQLLHLYAADLSLTEQLALLPTACYYEASVRHWDCLASAAKAREQLAQLLPPLQAAITLACLALGCQHLQQLPQRDWLWKQATLLLDRDVLVERFALLAALPTEAGVALPWQVGPNDTGECR